MKAEFAAIYDAWNPDTNGGRDENLTRSLSDQYVADHQADFDGYAQMSIESLVTAVDTFRAAGLEDDQARVEVWLWHHFEPQNIGGIYQPAIRVAGLG